jgi:hypothetical protein
MNGAGEVDVVAPLKLTKYSGSLPVEHSTITSLFGRSEVKYCCYNNQVEFEKGLIFGSGVTYSRGT